MIEFLSGAVTLAYFIASVFFLRFWRRTSDRLFLAFAIAFALFGLNQALVCLFDVYSESYSLLYALRVLGFIAILVAIVDKQSARSDLPARTNTDV
jgi:MFS family permease